VEDREVKTLSRQCRATWPICVLSGSLQGKFRVSVIDRSCGCSKGPCSGWFPLSLVRRFFPLSLSLLRLRRRSDSVKTRERQSKSGCLLGIASSRIAVWSKCLLWSGLRKRKVRVKLGKGGEKRKKLKENWQLREMAVVFHKSLFFHLIFF